MDFAGTLRVTWPQKNEGHILRGTKSAMFLLKTDRTTACTANLIKELEKLKGSDSCVECKDIAVLIDADNEQYQTLENTVYRVLERWETSEDKITVGLV